jgi:hypothetical protein
MTADLTANEARELTERITGQVSELLPLIREAFERRAWIALGHDSWENYCDAELRGLRLPVGARREAARELVSGGMSQRSAGAALGISRTQVRRDLDADQLSRDVPVEEPAAADEPDADDGAEPVESSAEQADPAPTAPVGAVVGPPLILGADGRRREAPQKRPDLTDTPERRDATTRTAVRKGVQAFLPVVRDLTPERVAEVADDNLWLELTHCRDRFVEWTDQLFAIRRRQSMHAVKRETA